jgi:trans-2,3-dihydro-3-hydroxyanthranilate isomerase
MRVPFRLVDVFTEEPFAGNQLCVVTDPPTDLTPAGMQTVAGEIGFSETTFVVEMGQYGYRMRIFTPHEELPFAGHPTLGTAFTLVYEGRIGPTAIQTTEAGEVPVEVDVAAGFAWMRQLPVTFGAIVADRPGVAAAAGLEPDDLIRDLPIRSVGAGIAHLMVPVRDEVTLRRAVRDGAQIRLLAEAATAESLYLFAVRGDGDVIARMFDKGDRIGEDAATGSAAGPLAAYLSVHRLAGMPGRTVIAQGETIGRPSFLHVAARAEGGGWTVQVGGGVRIVGEGSFEL